MADGYGFGDFAEDLGSGLPIIGGFFQAAAARKQRAEGEKQRADLMRRRAAGEFAYKTPNEILQSLSLAKSQFLNPELPGQGLAESKLRGNTSQAIGLARSSGRSPSDIMAAIVGANANENMAFNDLTVEAANRQLQDQMNYQRALSEKAGYSDKEWEYNTYMPMMQDRQYAESLIGAGNKNLYNAQQKMTNDIFKTASMFVPGAGMGSMFSGGQGGDGGANDDFMFGQRVFGRQPGSKNAYGVW